MFLLFVAALHAATPAGVEAYTQARWVRSSFVVTQGGVLLSPTYDPARAPVPWGVFDGRGHLLTAEAFASGAHDNGMLKRFDREQREKTTANVVATVVAIVAASAGTTVGGAPDLAPTDSGAPQSSPLWSWILGNRAVSDYYTAGLADELIVAHNAGLRREHGLTVEEAQAIDATPPGPAAR